MNPAIYFYAFRYALGRMTHVPGEVTREITKNIGIIPAEMKRRMIDEITSAETERRLGMDCDAITWTKFRETLQRP